MLSERQLSESLEKLNNDRRYIVRLNSDNTYMIFEYDRQGNEIVYPRAELTEVQQGKYTIYELNYGMSVVRFGVKNA